MTFRFSSSTRVQFSVTSPAGPSNVLAVRRARRRLVWWSRCLVGMQPTFMQVPPIHSFSNRTTDFPSWAALRAATYPPGPPPITAMSFVRVMILSSVVVFSFPRKR